MLHATHLQKRLLETRPETLRRGSRYHQSGWLLPSPSFSQVDSFNIRLDHGCTIKITVNSKKNQAILLVVNHFHPNNMLRYLNDSNIDFITSIGKPVDVACHIKDKYLIVIASLKINDPRNVSPVVYELSCDSSCVCKLHTLKTSRDSWGSNPLTSANKCPDMEGIALHFLFE